jgi:hypothetical protein
LAVGPPISHKSNGFHLEFRPYGSQLRQHSTSRVFPLVFITENFLILPRIF